MIEKNIMLAAINPYVEITVMQPTEEVTGKDFTAFGENNRYPEYIASNSKPSFFQ